MVNKKGHPFMKGKCLNCGSTSHLKAACNRPMATGRNLEAEYAEQQEGADLDDDPDAPADESEQPSTGELTSLCHALLALVTPE
eukprot:4012054-Amphidinium_carterae.1